MQVVTNGVTYEMPLGAEMHISMNVYAIQPRTPSDDSFLNIVYEEMAPMTVVSTTLDQAFRYHHRLVNCRLLSDDGSFFSIVELLLQRFPLYNPAFNGGEDQAMYHRRILGVFPHPSFHLSMICRDPDPPMPRRPCPVPPPIALAAEDHYLNTLN
jgi:hypothetical protein